MLQDILKLKGVQKLNNESKKSVLGGTNYGDIHTCLSHCAGSCNIFGRCFLYEK